MLIELPEDVLTLLDLINQEGYEAYVVGGCLRNYFLHKPIYDYDITTSAPPEELQRIFKNYETIEYGLKHGTLVVRLHHENYEITTYRIEKEYLDHRHPSFVSFTSLLEEDLKRRDFTMNALAYNPSTGVVDLFEGEDCIRQKRIKAIGNPNVRFDEDALRLMRAIRFASELGFKIDEETYSAMCTHKNLLNNISKERVLHELEKMLVGPSLSSTLDHYRDILPVVIKPLQTMPKEDYEYNVSLLETTNHHAMLRLFILLQSATKEDFIELSKALHLSTKQTNELLVLHEYKKYPLEANKPSIKRLLNAVGEDLFDLLLELYKTLGMSESVLKEIMTLKDEILEYKEGYSIKTLAINGKDLQPLGIQGEAIGSILNNILEEVLDCHLENKKEILLEYIKKQGNR